MKVFHGFASTTYMADLSKRLEVITKDCARLEGRKVTITHSWVAPSGVQVVSCVPREDEGWALLKALRYYATRVV